MSVLDIIRRCAEVPSFSSHEERLHPVVLDFIKNLPGVHHEVVPGNNLAIWTNAAPGAVTVVLSAHLDKINHLDHDSTEKLPYHQTDDELIGQLDDTVGVGLCLRLLERLCKQSEIALYVLLSEMEEGHGIKTTPHLLRNGGKDLHYGIGAERLSAWLKARKVVPKVILTLDPTPLFRGEGGIAVYSEHWRLNGIKPTPELIERTELAVRLLEELHPAIRRRNNGNDYLIYGREFNADGKGHVPSLAIEPAIHPCHAMPERVFIRDVQATEHLLFGFLTRLAGMHRWLA
jgi:hypothetical protein